MSLVIKYSEVAKAINIVWRWKSETRCTHLVEPTKGLSSSRRASIHRDSHSRHNRNRFLSSYLVVSFGGRKGGVELASVRVDSSYKQGHSKSQFFA